MLSEAAQAAKREKARLKRQQRALLKKQQQQQQQAAGSAISESATSSQPAKAAASSDAVLDLAASTSSSSSGATLVSSSRPVSRAMTSNTSIPGGEAVKPSSSAAQETDNLGDISHVEDWAAEEVSILLSNPSKSEKAAPSATAISELASTAQDKPKPVSKKQKNKKKVKQADTVTAEAVKTEEPATTAVAAVKQEEVANEAKMALKKQKVAEKNQRRKEKKALLQLQEKKEVADKAASPAAVSKPAQSTPAAPTRVEPVKEAIKTSLPAASTSKPAPLVGSASSKFATQPAQPKPSGPAPVPAIAAPSYALNPHSTGPTSISYLYNEPGSRAFQHYKTGAEELTLRVSLKPIQGYSKAPLEGSSRRKLRQRHGVAEVVMRRDPKRLAGIDQVSTAQLEAAPSVSLSGKGKQKASLEPEVKAAFVEKAIPVPVPRVASAPLEEPVSVPSFVSALDRKAISSGPSPVVAHLPALSRSQHYHQKASSTTSTAPSTTVPTPPPSTTSGQPVRPVLIGETTFYTSSPNFGITALDDPAVISSGTPRKSGFIPASEVEQTASTAIIEHSERYDSEAEKASELFMKRFVPDFKEAASRPVEPVYHQPMPYGYDVPQMQMYQPPTLPPQAFYGPDGQLYVYNAPHPPPQMYYPTPSPAAPLTKFIRSNVQPYDSPPISPHQHRPASSYPMSMSGSSASTPAHALQQVTANGTTYFIPAGEPYQQGYQGPVRDLEEFVQYGYPSYEGTMMQQQQQY